MDKPNYFIDSYVHLGRIGVLIELYTSEATDTEMNSFKSLARDLAMHIAAVDPSSIDDMLGQQFVRNQDQTVHDLISQAARKLHSEISIKRFLRWQAGSDEPLPVEPQPPDSPNSPAAIFDLRSVG
jgi:elongation factor Ts